MNIIAIVQARMGSARLPGKVMREIRGKPLIGYLLDRLVIVPNLDGVIVAIPERDRNTSLAAYVESRNISLFAGEEDDVAARFLALLEVAKPDAFVRVCADSPLLDPGMVFAMVEQMKTNGGDFLSSVGGLTPHGQYAELVRTSYYKAHFGNFTPEQREHAGFPYFYQIAPRLCVDTEADFERVKRVIEQMSGDHVEYDIADCCGLARLQ
jgi:spore coat polysaccharide biosynthesis protein SpsF (cytidylyltransferase family)